MLQVGRYLYKIEYFLFSSALSPFHHHHHHHHTLFLLLHPPPADMDDMFINNFKKRIFSSIINDKNPRGCHRFVVCWTTCQKCVVVHQSDACMLHESTTNSEQQQTIPTTQSKIIHFFFFHFFSLFFIITPPLMEMRVREGFKSAKKSVITVFNRALFFTMIHSTLQTNNNNSHYFIILVVDLTCSTR